MRCFLRFIQHVLRHGLLELAAKGLWFLADLKSMLERRGMFGVSLDSIVGSYAESRANLVISEREKQKQTTD